MKYKVYTVERWSSAFETWLACLFLYDFFRVWAILCTQSLQQRHQPAQNFWVHSEFLGFFVLYSRPLADFLSHLGKWVRLIKFEAENEFFVHLKGWKTTKYHIYTLILQCSCRYIGFNWIYMHFLKGFIFVPIHTFVVNQKLSQICTLKLRLLIRQTRVDSDCT